MPWWLSIIIYQFWHEQAYVFNITGIRLAEWKYMCLLNFDKFSIVLSIKSYQPILQQGIYKWGCFPIPHQHSMLVNFSIYVFSFEVLLLVKSNIFHMFKKPVRISIFVNYFYAYFAHFWIGQFILFLTNMEQFFIN